MKYATAVGRLETTGESLSTVGEWDKLVRDAYVFGELLDGPDELEVVSVAFVVDLPVAEVPWLSHPPAAEALVRWLRLDRVPVARLWRPAGWPVWNHEIARAVRFWSSSAGTDQGVLALLRERQFDDLDYVGPPDQKAFHDQLRIELQAARKHLGEVLDSYHERGWAQEHRQFGFRTDDHLWWAAQAFFELDAAVRGETGRYGTG